MGILNWDFLDEPLYRWFIFFVALTLFLAVWGSILAYIRSAV